MRYPIYISILLCFLLSGCASNGFQKFYKPTMTPAEINRLEIEQCAYPVVKALPPNTSPTELANIAYENGYMLIGYSAWGGPAHEGSKEASQQAKDINACLVMWNMSYAETRHGAYPVTTYSSGTTSTVYLPSGGMASIYTPGSSSTSYVPYSIARYNYTGLFYGRVKRDPFVLGIRIAIPPTDYMQETDSKDGILVTSVMKGSAAYEANIFRGDILVTINGQPCKIDKALPLIAHQKNEIVVYRNGKIIIKEIFLPATTDQKPNKQQLFHNRKRSKACYFTPFDLA